MTGSSASCLESGCFSSCPAGAQLESQSRVAYMDVGKGRDDCMDAGGRTTQETKSSRERKLYNSYEGLVIHCELRLALTSYLNSEACISK